MEIKKYIIKTYGCQMNEHDSERMSYMLQTQGYVETDNFEDADLIIYNTCTIRENAELKVYGHLGAMKALKDKKTNLIIAVCGCMMEIEETRNMIRDKFKQVDIVFGTKNLSSLPYLLNQYEISNERVIDVENSDDIDDFQHAIRKNKYSAYVNIIYGCDNFCSYCIVPYTRGRESSRSEASIVSEVRDLGRNGYKEITLLGQNVNSYGKDLQPCTSFAHLLEEVDKVGSIGRIRFISSHPKDLSEDMVIAIRDHDKICNSIHLPLQSGSTSILRKMNRRYTAEHYYKQIEMLRQIIPEIAITTDIIIGFPGETDQDFNYTLEMVKKVEYDQAFIFKYSKRAGTRAAEMENQVPENVKSERFQKLLDTVNDICYKKNSKYMGTIQEVLVEGYSKNDKNKLTGRTETNKIVNINASDEIIGKIVPIRITSFNSFALEGETID